MKLIAWIVKLIYVELISCMCRLPGIIANLFMEWSQFRLHSNSFKYFIIVCCTFHIMPYTQISYSKVCYAGMYLMLVKLYPTNYSFASESYQAISLLVSIENHIPILPFKN